MSLWQYTAIITFRWHNHYHTQPRRWRWLRCRRRLSSPFDTN